MLGIIHFKQYVLCKYRRKPCPVFYIPRILDYLGYWHKIAAFFSTISPMGQLDYFEILLAIVSEVVIITVFHRNVYEVP